MIFLLYIPVNNKMGQMNSVQKLRQQPRSDQRTSRIGELLVEMVAVVVVDAH